MTLTPDQCDKIKTELEKTGADIKNVTYEQGWWAGRGAYNSLFVRVYNYVKLINNIQQYIIIATTV